MTTTYTDTCDGCGKTRVWSHDANASRFPAWWDWTFSSTDFPTPEGTYRFRSAGWDLCDECSAKARAAIEAVVGKPHHDDTGDE